MIRPMHPLHAAFVSRTNGTDLDYLFRLLDQLDEDDRDELIGFPVFAFLSPMNGNMEFPEEKRFRELHGEALTHGDTPYEKLKRRLRRLSVYINEHILVVSVVSQILATGLAQGDESQIASVEANNWSLAERLSGDESAHEDIKALADMAREHALTAESRIMISSRRYEEFCDRVVLDLLGEMDRRQSDPFGSRR